MSDTLGVCPFCAAAPGALCVTSSGAPARRTHTARLLAEVVAEVAAATVAAAVEVVAAAAVTPVAEVVAVATPAPELPPWTGPLPWPTPAASDPRPEVEPLLNRTVAGARARLRLLGQEARKVIEDLPRSLPGRERIVAHARSFRAWVAGLVRDLATWSVAKAKAAWDLVVRGIRRLGRMVDAAVGWTREACEPLGGHLGQVVPTILTTVGTAYGGLLGLACVVTKPKVTAAVAAVAVFVAGWMPETVEEAKQRGRREARAKMDKRNMEALFDAQRMF